MIVAKNIKKSYNGEEVLRGIDLKIEKGDFISIMGESGSGKSTLISILAGMLTPDEGKVLIDGVDISTMTEGQLAEKRCTDMGFVFQSYRLIDTLNVKDNLLLPTVLGKKLTEEALEYLNELCERLGISHLLAKYPSQLSGGQCQRVAIARALLYKPELIILDEPTGALDSAMETKAMELLSNVNKTLGTTIIQVTHSMRVAEYANRIINIKDGVISQ